MGLSQHSIALRAGIRSMRNAMNLEPCQRPRYCGVAFIHRLATRAEALIDRFLQDTDGQITVPRFVKGDAAIAQHHGKHACLARISRFGSVLPQDAFEGRDGPFRGILYAKTAMTPSRTDTSDQRLPAASMIASTGPFQANSFRRSSGMPATRPRTILAKNA